jgi:hypothetical protein
MGFHISLRKSPEHAAEDHHQRADGHFILSGPSARGGVFNGSKFPEYEADMDIIDVTYFYS